MVQDAEDFGSVIERLLFYATWTPIRIGKQNENILQPAAFSNKKSP